MMKISKMASLAVFFCTCSIIAAGLVSAERVFKVGDGFGWQKPGQNSSAVYTQWAKTNRFQVGDSLSFEYKNDSVVEVEKWGYFHCDASKPIVAFNNGHGVFKLDRPGPFFFISGTLNHCKGGQRLQIEVMGLHHHSPLIANPPAAQPAPSPLQSSGVFVSMTRGSSSALLIGTLIALLWSSP
ncbi:BLUE COPPER PROTEIN [Salix purpurea]|uniref:BLUE COPPER PROTEIN n=1 Tax=Salix purpurea TaxID=77065 RepID=A0A9Q0TH22_SALPP|nr:BLUE COPPER PROTEIN [Salix purpurea]